MTPVFGDAYYCFAVVSPKDRGHARAMSFASGPPRPIVTTAWVLTELADGLCAAANRRLFLRLLDLIRNDPLTTVLLADQPLMDRGLALYAARPDKDWSLTDCISFVVMTEQGLTDALTGDHHFEQAGFRALLA
jgi:hypothetical protein